MLENKGGKINRLHKIVCACTITRIDTPAAEAGSRAAIYDMNGRQLNTKPDNGIYIQDGKKYMAK